MKHRAWIQSLPCVICGDPTSTEAAHVRYSEWRSGKTNPGKGKKPADCWLVALCGYHHRMQHQTNEREFWNSFSMNPVTCAQLLSHHSGDINELPEILRKSSTKTDEQTHNSPELRTYSQWHRRGNTRLL